MITRTAIVAEARGWIGTPYIHQHRTKGVGVDCVGLLICVARGLQMVAPDFDIVGYSRQPDGSLLAKCGQLMTRIHGDPQPGDAVVMRFDSDPCHLGIVGDYHVAGNLSLIHALGTRDGKGRVVEHRLTEHAKVVGAFSFPGVA